MDEAQKVPTEDASNKDFWKHRSSMMKCYSCMWYISKNSKTIFTPEYEVGRCRRHCPTMGGFPVVRGGDWCGDHKLDENKA